MLIFDIGANIGQFTQKCIDTYKNCSIVCVEPNPKCYLILNEKFLKTNNVKIVPLLVSKNNDEYIDFYECDVLSTASKDWMTKSRFSNVIYPPPIKIKTINLNKLIDLYGLPDLIKIDVEGYEYEVILGLNKKNKKICFEWVEEQFELIKKICLHLNSLGYSEFGYIEGDSHLEEPQKYTNLDSVLTDIHNNINPNRKEKWGMMWSK